MKKNKLPRLSETECSCCKHKFLCYSHKDWEDDIETSKQLCDNYVQIENEHDADERQMTIFDYI